MTLLMDVKRIDGKRVIAESFFSLPAAVAGKKKLATLLNLFIRITNTGNDAHQ
jgi:hypothetical protein